MIGPISRPAQVGALTRALMVRTGFWGHVRVFLYNETTEGILFRDFQTIS